MTKAFFLFAAFLISVIFVCGCIEADSQNVPEPDDPLQEDSYVNNTRMDKTKSENSTTISIDDVSVEVSNVQDCLFSPDEPYCGDVAIEVTGTIQGYAACFGGDLITSFFDYPDSYVTVPDYISGKEYVTNRGVGLDNEGYFPAPYYPDTGCTESVTWSAHGGMYQAFKGKQQIMVVATLFDKDTGYMAAQATEIVTPFP